MENVAYRMLLVCAVIAGLGVACAFAASAPAQPMKRCGWFENPTPGNASLVDRDGEWIIGEQGGHQADGDWPEFSDARWVRTNGSHGYGCACITMAADAKSHEVSTILHAVARPLKACRADRALAKPSG